MRGRSGVLLVNLGTPDAADVGAVRRYLREFLSDPRVVDVNPVARWLLVNLVIAPFRAPRSAEAYRKVWTERGSPLLFHGEDLAAGVRSRLAGEVAGVELAMRYRNPSIAAGLARLMAAGAGGVVVFPLFPQYSMAAWESAVVAVLDELARQRVVPPVRVVPPFFAHPRFLDAVTAVARPVLDGLRPERVLISFHGVPERHLRRSEGTGFCYREHCFATARGVAGRLGLGEDRYEVAFQSRLGRTPWIRPFTDERIVDLAQQGTRRLAVLCPSFVADCLETIEEIGIRGREAFVSAGGERLELVPCVNASPAWLDGAAAIVREHLPATSGEE